MDGEGRREELIRAAARAYEAAHGNPIAEPVRGMRWHISRRVGVTLVVMVAIVLAATVLATRPRPTTLGPPAGGIAESTIAATAASHEGLLTVHITGAVANPDVYDLPAGARVIDAVEAAGGALPDAELGGVNLARGLQDGEQVVVPRIGEVGAAAAGINLNSADAGALEELPGIGPVLADRIVNDRSANGPFSSLDDLSRVSGVGPAILAQLRGLATV